MKKDVTPYGEDCVVADTLNREDMEILAATLAAAKGSWQRQVLEELFLRGYIIGDKPTGRPIKGKAASWKSKYDRSLANLMLRAAMAVPDPYRIEYTIVGPRGASGYRLYLRGENNGIL